MSDTTPTPFEKVEPGSFPVIAIDGPAASGKSSTARAVAEALGMVHMESGALYRTATLIALRQGLTDPGLIASAAREAGVELVRQGSSLGVSSNGHDVEPAIREQRVTSEVSAVAAMPFVRDWVDSLLRDAVVSWGGAVMDGRDIGTVVFPDARLKVFLTATPDARAYRRLLQEGLEPDENAVAAQAERLAKRDQLDSERPIAPLLQADDALLLETTDLRFEDQVARILNWASERGL